MATGSYLSGKSRVAVAEVWNGSQWLMIPTPKSEAGSSVITSVSCAATTTKCTATGRLGGELGELAAFSWNGEAWSILPAPPGTASDISCAPSSGSEVCMSVNGSSDTAQIWNGSTGTWTTTTPSSPPLETNPHFHAVDCLKATHCVAVGYWKNPAAGQGVSSLLEQWDSSSGWTFETTPSGAFLEGVSCGMLISCMAVGEQGLNQYEPKTLALRLN